MGWIFFVLQQIYSKIYCYVHGFQLQPCSCPPWFSLVGQKGRGFGGEGVLLLWAEEGDGLIGFGGSGEQGQPKTS